GRAVAEGVGRGLGVAVVALHDAGTLDQDLAHLARTRATGAVRRGDLHPHALASPAHRHEAPRRVGTNRLAVWPDRHCEGCLGEPVSRRKDVADAEALLECTDRREPHWLGAGHRHPEAGEVETGGVVDVAPTP